MLENSGLRGGSQQFTSRVFKNWSCVESTLEELREVGACLSLLFGFGNAISPPPQTPPPPLHPTRRDNLSNAMQGWRLPGPDILRVSGNSILHAASHLNVILPDILHLAERREGKRYNVKYSLQAHQRDGASLEQGSRSFLSP